MLPQLKNTMWNIENVGYRSYEMNTADYGHPRPARSTPPGIIKAREQPPLARRHVITL